MANLKSLGLSDRHPFYTSWLRMKQRCNNPYSTQYCYYGGRGITYDPRWNDFDNFYNDMWSTWAEGLTLDRIRNSQGYSKSNCRWATRKEQANNKRPYKLDVRNTSGVKGVYYNRVTEKWLAQVYEKGKRRTIYSGKSFEEARAARREWEGV